MATIEATMQRTTTRATSSTLVVAKRSLLKFLRTPQLIVLGTLQGALFLFIFRYVFGGAMDAGGLSYVDFLVPGFITTMALFAGQNSAIGIAEDVEHGVLDRLRSLPISRSSVLAGRALADMAMLVWTVAVMVGIGFAVGFRFHGSGTDAVVAFALVIAYGFAFEWVFLALGMASGNAQAAQNLGFMVFPLTFVSSAYVPVESMPGWMQAVAEHQPVTYMVDAVRALCLGSSRAVEVLGHNAGYFIGWSIVWTVLIVAVFAPLAVARFRRG